MKTVAIIGSSGNIGEGLINLLNQRNKIIGIDKMRREHTTDIQLFKEFVLDISKSDNQIKVATILANEKITIDGLVFCMGVNSLENFYSVREEVWDETFETNLKSLVFILKHFYSLFSDQVSIVIIGSQNGVVGHESRIDYGPSKAALIQLVKNLTIDFEQDKNRDIKINIVSPSYIINDSNRDFLMNSLEGKKMLSKIPLRKFVTIEDVTEAICFLLSTKSKAIRGQNILVDYGYTIV